MNLSNYSIGTRLAWGFGLTLLLFTATLAGLMISNASARADFLVAVDQAAAKESLAVQMRTRLLTSAVAVRNMGLETEVDTVQRDQDVASKERAAYVEAKNELRKLSLTAEAKVILDSLESIDSEMATAFKEAVDLASQFNADQAAKIITQKIDPLMLKEDNQLTSFISLQKKSSQEARYEAESRSHRAQIFAGLGAMAVLGIAGVIGFLITVSITKPLKIAVASIERVAGGDLSERIEVHGSDETGRVLIQLRSMQEQLRALVCNVRQGVDQMSISTREIANGNSDLSRRTESQASNLQETAASLEQITTGVERNAQASQGANEMARAASEAAVDGGKVFSEVVSTMQDISLSSKKIADIIVVIDGIAFQTNILALNAAVEAARAGEQGRGFAVVASEVRSLAIRSADAAKEIKALIGASVERVDSGSRLVSRAGESIEDIVSRIERVAAIISEISESASQQTTGIVQIKQAVTQLDEVTQQNAALVEQSAAAAESLNHQAGSLVSLVGTFKV